MLLACAISPWPTALPCAFAWVVSPPTNSKKRPLSTLNHQLRLRSRPLLCILCASLHACFSFLDQPPPAATAQRHCDVPDNTGRRRRPLFSSTSALFAFRLRRRMDGSGVARGAPSLSPTSPTSSRQGNGIPKRKRSIGIPAHLESSPGSDNDDEHGDDKKRQPGVKRACNECRQQKVSQRQALQHEALQHQHFRCATTTLGRSSQYAQRPIRPLIPNAAPLPSGFGFVTRQ